MQIDHIAIWTDDLEKVKEFYLKYFEGTAGEKYVNHPKNFCSYFITFNGGARLELMKRYDLARERAGERLGIAHFAIDAGDRLNVDRITEIIRNDGYKVLSNPRITGDGYYESVILDPEGNMVEIMSW